MNYRVVLNVLGTVIKFLGISLLAPLLVALYYHESDSIRIFAISSLVVFLMGILLEYMNRSSFDELSQRESIVIVALGWLMAAILGGIGNLKGAIFGSLILGVIQSLAAGYLSTTYKDVISFLILIGVLLIRPTGIFGKGTVEKV